MIYVAFKKVIKNNFRWKGLFFSLFFISFSFCCFSQLWYFELLFYAFFYSCVKTTIVFCYYVGCQNYLLGYLLYINATCFGFLFYIHLFFSLTSFLFCFWNVKFWFTVLLWQQQKRHKFGQHWYYLFHDESDTHICMVCDDLIDWWPCYILSSLLWLNLTPPLSDTRSGWASWGLYKNTDHNILVHQSASPYKLFHSFKSGISICL